jgi:beta-carotene hydroxylase
MELLVLYLLHNGHISHYWGMAVNTIVVYAAFTPMHDASHGSIGNRQYSFLNSLSGNLAGFCFPVPFPAFKHIHLLHHKHTNEDADPDKWAGLGPSFFLPLRWLTMELKYYVIYIPKLTSRPASEAMQTVVILAAMVFVIVGLCNMGYGKTILWGWILPGRLATALLAYFFDYLPHRPHAVSKNHSPYVATNVTSLVGEHTAPLTRGQF